MFFFLFGFAAMKIQLYSRGNWEFIQPQTTTLYNDWEEKFVTT